MSGHNASSGRRDNWAGRSAFVLAAIGSAVGLGNLWSFPYKAYIGGGGAFLIPYFIAMAVMGIPLLIMEFTVGHWAQQSPPGAFARIHSRYRFAGWWLTILAFVIITYYTVILGYCLLFLVESVRGIFGTSLPWAGGNEAADAYFNMTVLAREKGSLAVHGFQWPVVAGLAASWVMIYFCLFKGVKWVSKVVLITVPLPWIMLAILTVRGLTMEGSRTGLEFYLEPQWDKLASADTWRLAFGQVFFSMSLGFAVMLSYASFLKRSSDLNNNALIVGLGDLATSFIAGLAVFGTLGGMAYTTNVAVKDAVMAGPDLAFITFPYALAQLPAGQAFFSLVFFAALLTLGIDSAFSIVEACLASVCDNTRWTRSTVLPVICVIGFVPGLLFCTSGGGLDWLYLADDLVNGPAGILVAALAECLVIGWAWKGRTLRQLRLHANERSDWSLHLWWDWTVRYIAPGLLLVLIAWSISDFIYKESWSRLIGTGVFMLIPVGLWLTMGGRSKSETREDQQERTRALMLFTSPIISMVVGAITGLIRLAFKVPQKAAEHTTSPFEARDIQTTAYIIIGLVTLIIVGGLAWCFWRAMIAAGSSDEVLDMPGPGEGI